MRQILHKGADSFVFLAGHQARSFLIRQIDEVRDKRHKQTISGYLVPIVSSSGIYDCLYEAYQINKWKKICY